ncbi:MAG TPA: sigma 54-interacting transcriptional regulator [Gemmatimonadales bacterium]|nr:sigma 54-interacting transcriptional regulator [Gemmatimonadales bacterium]
MPPDVQSLLLGHTPPMKQLAHRARLFAQRRRPILLLGESGTGKTWLAQRLHDLSPFRAGKFVPVPAPQLEALGLPTLVGHSDHAYTGAKRSEPGAMEEAINGTLFLDEVGVASPEVQNLLVTLVEASKVQRLGERRRIPVRIRLMAATNEPLKLRVEQGRFRGDLYWRLKTFSLYLPPLRKRKHDIPDWARQFLMEEADYEGLSAPVLSPGACQRLIEHEWPGNLRELKSVMARTLALLPDQPIIEADDLDFDASDPSGKPARVALTEDRVCRAIKRNGGNRTRAAEELGVTERHTRRILPPERTA